MKTMKWIFAYSVLSLFFLTSCLEETGNRVTRESLAVVRMDNDGKIFLSTNYIYDYGWIAAPQLDNRDLKDGDCLFISFTIDFDNQPSTNYYTATKIGYAVIDQADIEDKSTSEIIEDEYTDSIIGMGYTYLDNKLFIQTVQYAAQKQEYKYELVCNTDSIDEENNIYNLYLRASKNNTASGTLQNQVYSYAFDMVDFYNQHGSDGKISFNVKFKSGEDAEQNDIYSLVNLEPVTIVFEIQDQD